MKIITHSLLWDHMQLNHEQHGERCAIVVDDRRWSYSDLYRDAIAMAAAMKALGVEAGDSVSYQLPNGYEAAVIFLAVLRIGAVANPIVPIMRRHEVGFILNQMHSTLMFVPQSFRGFDYPHMMSELDLSRPLTMIVCGGDAAADNSYETLMAAGRTLPPPPLVRDPDTDAVVLYTSGTSGNPKGVRHSQRGLLFEASTYIRYSGLTSDSVSLAVSPLSHITGLCHVHLIPQLIGARVCLLAQWDPQVAMALIEREGCTWMGGATPFLRMLVDALDENPGRISTLKVFRCGGADVPESLVRAAHAHGMETVRCYGSTEHPTISGACGVSVDQAATTDGLVHEHVELRIVDMADEQRLLGIGQAGEIQSRGPELFLGYRDARLDREAFTQDGWFRTGDIGVLDAEGCITIVGRKKDIIIRKGENISAREVEDAIALCEAVEQVAVIGLPDAERGEMVVAVCVGPGARELTLADLKQHLDTLGLARQKYPERLEWVAQMPMTASGKIRKVELKQRFSV